MTPERAMRLALSQARRAEGRTHPNPAVGAVVYRGERILGRGCTRPPGGDHAEIVALRAAARRFGAAALRGASLAVTLEPCSHVGRTGPCADAIVEAGIRRVFVGHGDPSAHARGRGVRRLRAARVRTELGVLEEECRWQHRGFLSVVERGHPFVTLKLASTLDGRIATRRGDSRWISGQRARDYVHALRRRTDAIGVGSGTARADDPELSARRNGRIVHRPTRVLFDTRLGVPTSAKLYQGSSTTIVVCAHRAPAVRRTAVAKTGARVLTVATRGGHLDLRGALRGLAREGILTLLLEGGGTLAAAFLQTGLVDEVRWITAPKLIGADGAPALGALGVVKLRDALIVEPTEIRRLGGDLLVRGSVVAKRSRR